VLELAKIMKCVVPAARLGKRFYPLTRAQPKEMLPILDKPVMHYVVEEAVNSGLDEILIIVGSGKDAIINYFDRHTLDDSMDRYGFRDLPDIYFVRQNEQKSLADVVRYAENFTGDDDFVVLLGDTIYRSANERTVTSQILDVYGKIRKPLVAVEQVPREKIKDYGIVDPDADPFRIKGVVEKPEVERVPSDLGITGIYVLGTYIYDAISMIRPGRNGELQLSDVYNVVKNQMDVYATRINGKRYDITSECASSDFHLFQVIASNFPSAQESQRGESPHPASEGCSMNSMPSGARLRVMRKSKVAAAFLAISVTSIPDSCSSRIAWPNIGGCVMSEWPGCRHSNVAAFSLN